MIQLTREYTRPSEDVLWHWEALSLPWDFDYYSAAYIITGKILFETRSETPDPKLNVTFTMLFDSMASYEEYDNDPKLNLYWNERNTYNEEHNIVLGPKVVIEI